MRKLLFAAACISLLYLYGCQKNDCQTFIQGSWIVVNPLDSSYIARDSVRFTSGDSIREYYKYRITDTAYGYHHTAYFISDQCNEIDFLGINTWDSVRTETHYSILQISNDHFQIRSKADSAGCTSCVIDFHR